MRFVPSFPTIEGKRDKWNYLSRFIKNDYWKELAQRKEESWLNRKQKHFHRIKSSLLEEIVTTPEEEVKRAVMVGDTTVMIDDVHYEIVEDYRDGFNIVLLNEARFARYFWGYDYIVGDWGPWEITFERFLPNIRINWRPDRDIDYLQEYLLEYCVILDANISCIGKETQRQI